MSLGQYHHENKYKYLKPPSQELILEVIKKSGVNAYQFGRFYGIPASTLNFCVLYGKPRPLPAKYWGVFYEPDPQPVPRIKRKARSKKGYRAKIRVKQDAAVSSLL